MGGSNGGLLTGNIFVRGAQKPELIFSAIVSQCPLLDMKRFHKLLAGASWMAEYGNPDLGEYEKFIKNYSPYQMIEAMEKAKTHSYARKKL